MPAIHSASQDATPHRHTQELKKAELAKVQEENRYLTTTFEQAQQRLADLNRNFDDSMSLLTEKIQRLSAAKKQAEADKEKYVAEIEKTEQTLSKLRVEKETENEENNKKLEALDTEYHSIVRENEEADAEIAGAQADVSRAKAQLTALREEHKKLSEQNGTTSKHLADVEAEHKDLLAVNKALLAKVSEAKEQLATTDRHKTDVQTQIEDMSQEIKRITRNHDDLKKFVRNRFFPTGQVPSGVVEPPPPRQHMSPQRAFPQPKGTLKTQQQQKAREQKKAAQNASLLRSASGTSPRVSKASHRDPVKTTTGSSHINTTLARRVRSPAGARK